MFFVQNLRLIYYKKSKCPQWKGLVSFFSTFSNLFDENFLCKKKTFCFWSIIGHVKLLKYVTTMDRVNMCISTIPSSGKALSHVVFVSGLLTDKLWCNMHLLNNMVAMHWENWARKQLSWDLHCLQEEF